MVVIGDHSNNSCSCFCNPGEAEAVNISHESLDRVKYLARRKINPTLEHPYFKLNSDARGSDRDS